MYREKSEIPPLVLTTRRRKRLRLGTAEDREISTVRNMQARIGRSYDNSGIGSGKESGIRCAHLVRISSGQLIFAGARALRDNSRVSLDEFGNPYDFVRSSDSARRDRARSRAEVRRRRN